MATVKKENTKKSVPKKGKSVVESVSVTDKKTALTSDQKVEVLALDLISCNPFNPRKHNSDEDLQELASSIKIHGVIQPITVRGQDGFYEIICGERRYHASFIAGLTTIPAIVTQLSDEEAMEITIVENLQRKDISPVEESNAFKLLMDKRNYSIEELTGRFAKSDSYVRGRLQLCNLITDIADLLSNNEVTITISLELSKLCSEIQADIYNDHLKESDGYQCWRNLNINDFRSRIKQKYCSDLSKFDFDKTECFDCRFNSALQDLFAVDKCGNCQNIACLQEKHKLYMVNSAIQIVDSGRNYAACVRPNSADPAIIGQLKEQGVDVYEMYPSRFPEEPQKPLADDFDSTEEYNEAVQEYEADVIDYKDSIESIEKMEAEGKIQRLVDVTNTTPTICYRVIPDEDHEPQEDPVVKMKAKDLRNKEISIEKTVAEVKQFTSEKSFPDTDFTEREEVLLYFVLFSSLRRREFNKFGLKDPWGVTDEQKIKLAEKLTVKQKTTLKREYISSHLSGATGAGKLAELLIEFSMMHFPDDVSGIKQQHDDVYEKRHKSLTERIKAAEQPVESVGTIDGVAVDGETNSVVDVDAETEGGIETKTEGVLETVNKGNGDTGTKGNVDFDIDSETKDNDYFEAEGVKVFDILENEVVVAAEVAENEETTENFADDVVLSQLIRLPKKIIVGEKAESVALEAV
jgi:ParB family chromosome partitioning protein